MKYDVVIVGSGASGGAVAHTLTEAGFKVAVLEKGRLLKREEFSKDELAYCRRDIVTPNLFEEYHTIEEKVDGKWETTPTYDPGGVSGMVMSWVDHPILCRGCYIVCIRMILD